MWKAKLRQVFFLSLRLWKKFIRSVNRALQLPEAVRAGGGQCVIGVASDTGGQTLFGVSEKWLTNFFESETSEKKNNKEKYMGRSVVLVSALCRHGEARKKINNVRVASGV